MNENRKEKYFFHTDRNKSHNSFHYEGKAALLFSLCYTFFLQSLCQREFELLLWHKTFTICENKKWWNENHLSKITLDFLFLHLVTAVLQLIFIIILCFIRTVCSVIIIIIITILCITTLFIESGMMSISHLPMSLTVFLSLFFLRSLKLWCHIAEHLWLISLL